jgi:hypothetical protein
MSFERIDFSYLFHDGFRLDRKALILHLAIENRIYELAERAVLSALLSGSGERPDPSAIPVLDDDAVQDAFYQLQVRLDCYDAEQAERMVGGCGTDLEEVHAALHRALVRRRIASALVRRAVTGEGDAQTAICWEAFTAGALRGDALRAMAIGLAADAEPAAPSEAELAQARSHLASMHPDVDWTAVHDKLTVEWGVPATELSAAVERYARALRGGGAR